MQRSTTSRPIARTRSAVLSLTAISALAALTACGSAAGDDTANAGGGTNETITVYTSEPQAKIDEIVSAFEEQHDGANVEVFRAATGELKARLATEQESGGIQADVLLAADVPTFEAYAAEGALAELDIDNAGDLEDNLLDKEGFWVGTRIIPTVIAYNTEVISDAPTSWAELTNAEYSGQIAMPNPDVSGAAAFNTAVWLTEDDLGETWLEDLVANDPTVLESNGPVGQAVAGGTNGIGIVVDYVIRELAEQGSPVDLEYPTDGVPYVSQPAGVFANSENQETANAFVDFLISEQGQQLAVEQSYLPVRGDVGVPEGAPELAELNLLDPDLNEIAATQNDAVDLFNSMVR